ncbi:hypothetical protein B0H17DRAFT_627001 [Mycena rosella]|uniref:Uncharacterized protein n=1 Tax=Mycena rosella TaxID=1033263 RepID=A0AAD7GVZ4_MYCRO|nr:hypothetical protein B0H17DRAFT_627001 [Mycena rosella]
MPKPGNHGGPLGISPGQVLPRNFQFYPPAALLRPGRSTVGLPRLRRPICHKCRPGSRTGARRRQSRMVDGRRRIRAPHPRSLETHRMTRAVLTPRPRIHRTMPAQLHPTCQPPSPMRPAHPSYDNRTSYDIRASYIPPQTQYDPVDLPPQPRDTNPYRARLTPQPSAHTSFASEDYDTSAAYGGIEEEEIAPPRDRRSAPPVPTAVDPHFDSNGFQPRRHNARPGFTPPQPLDPRGFPDPIRLSAGQSQANLRHSPNGQPVAGFIDPRLLQHREQQQPGPGHGQDLSGMRRSPSGDDSRLQQQHYPTPPAGSSHHAHLTNKIGGDRHRISLNQRHSSRRILIVLLTSSNRLASILPWLSTIPAGAHLICHRRHQEPQPPISVDSTWITNNVSPHPCQISVDSSGSPATYCPPARSTAEHCAVGCQFHQRSRGPQPQHIPKHLVMPTPCSKPRSCHTIPASVLPD